MPCPSLNPLNSELNPIYHLLALLEAHHILHVSRIRVNLLNAELHPTYHLLALLEAHHIFHVSRIRVKEPCVLYIGRAYRYPPDVAFLYIFFNNYNYRVF